MIVIDASVTLTYLLPDEHDPIAVEAFHLVRAGRSAAPAHWATEVMNGLRMAERRGRLQLSDVDEIMRQFIDFRPDIERIDDLETATAILDLARSQNLTVYDAAYLELARRRGCPLATLDEKLAEAARKTGVALAGS